jgi:hypothetical protein
MTFTAKLAELIEVANERTLTVDDDGTMVCYDIVGWDFPEEGERDDILPVHCVPVNGGTGVDFILKNEVVPVDNDQGILRDIGVVEFPEPWRSMETRRVDLELLACRGIQQSDLAE